jgi:aminoglycoside phosphotransferase (APT) family kinase protein
MSLITRALEMMVRVHRTSVQSLAADARRFGRTFEDILIEFESALTELQVVDVLVLDYARVWLASTHSLLGSDEGTLVHGDFRLANLLWEPDGSCHILDWEAAHIGSGLFDLAWLCMGAVEDSDMVMGLAPKAVVVACYESLKGEIVRPGNILWWQVAAAWIRGCTEARLLDRFLLDPESPALRDPQELLWEFGSYRTDREILSLIDRFEAPRPVA